MKNFLGFLVSIILTINLCGCSNNNQSHKKTSSLEKSGAADLNYKEKNFDSLLKVNAHLDLTYYGELLNDKAFIDVMQHDSLYLGDAITFLTNNNFTQDQVAVCLCAMQYLKPDDYVKFCKLMLGLYDENKITHFALVEYAIWGPPGFLKNNRIVVNNYKNPEVIDLLRSIENDRKVPGEIRKQIPDILSGKTMEDLQDFE